MFTLSYIATVMPLGAHHGSPETHPSLTGSYYDEMHQDAISWRWFRRKGPRENGRLSGPTRGL